MTSAKGVASIWITRGKYKDDNIYQQFDCKVDDAQLLVHWNGQESGRDDHLVFAKKHITHVFFRKSIKEEFKYLGVIDNKTITGPHGEFDHDEREPATYHFYINTTGKDLLKPSGTVCNLIPELGQVGRREWKLSAMKTVGLKGGNCGSGIMEHKKVSL